MIFWRYGNSLYFFFVALVGIASIFVFLIAKPVQQDIPNVITTPLEIFGFTYYQLSEQSIPLELHAKHAYRSIQDGLTKEYIINLQATKQDPISQEREILSTDLMIRDHQIFSFPNGVNFWRNETFFWSQQGTYITQEQFFQGQGDFLIQPTINSIINGIDLSYDYILGISSAKAIKAFLEENE